MYRSTVFGFHASLSLYLAQCLSWMRFRLQMKKYFIHSARMISLAFCIHISFYGSYEFRNKMLSLRVFRTSNIDTETQTHTHHMWGEPLGCAWAASLTMSIGTVWVCIDCINLKIDSVVVGGSKANDTEPQHNFNQWLFGIPCQNRRPQHGNTFDRMTQYSINMMRMKFLRFGYHIASRDSYYWKRLQETTKNIERCIQSFFFSLSIYQALFTYPRHT